MRFEDFDAVIMLTHSDWKKEPKANRYNYAIRLAKHQIVLFVQPDLHVQQYVVEKTEIPRIEIVHIYDNYGIEQDLMLKKALIELGIKKIILWVYNARFKSFIARSSNDSTLCVYHATEDYFSDDFCVDNEIRESIAKIAPYTDLVLSVSAGVAENYIENCSYRGAIKVLGNGCDYDFYHLGIKKEKKEKIAIYQGGINKKIDLDMLFNVVQLMKDWRFDFAGGVYWESREEKKIWEDLVSKENVRYYGELEREVLREKMHNSSIGIIPFKRNDWLVRRSFPLKAYEYAACGLPVVSTPIAALENEGIFFTAENDALFACAMELAFSAASDEAFQIKLDLSAKGRNYNNIVNDSISFVNDVLMQERKYKNEKLNVLVLYDPNSTHVKTIQDHLLSFSEYSNNNIFYASGIYSNIIPVPVHCFDAVIVHYSIRLSLVDHINSTIKDNLKYYSGLKVLYIQDEYENPLIARQNIKDIGFDIVYTCVPGKYIDKVYPKIEFPYTVFKTVLTGYVTSELEETARQATPLEKRKLDIGYRGRKLSPLYGILGYEKYIIGKKVKELCSTTNLSIDIEWEEDKRIYGTSWFTFIDSCVSMLGSESGSNVFDFESVIENEVADYRQSNTNATDDDIVHNVIAKHEGDIDMRQVSPKVFEAVAHKTALILFEGNYSGILKPWTHYLPLKKDFSNWQQIVDLVGDRKALQAIVDNACRDIIYSGEYSYSKVISAFDNDLRTYCSKGSNKQLTITSVLGMQVASGKYQPCHLELTPQIGSSAKLYISPPKAPNPLAKVIAGNYASLWKKWHNSPKIIKKILMPLADIYIHLIRR
jgi:glycosyltransferase involved in cell wall biosynthesis